MMDGSNKLTCIGIIGDGCGGGREFSVKDETLRAYDPQSKEIIVLLEDIKDAVAISKKGCSIFITCENENIEFNLSSMSITKQQS